MSQTYADGRIKFSVHSLPVALMLFFAPLGVFTLPLAPLATSKLEISYPVVASGANWIMLDSDVQGVYPVSVQSIRAVLEDYTSAVDIFPRVAAVRTTSEAAGTVLLTQRYEIEILAFRFPTESTIRMSADLSALPLFYRLSWSFVGSDGSMADSRGFWEIRDASEDGQTRAALRHRTESLIRKDFPVQERIMRMFAEKELQNTLDAVVAAARGLESR